MMNPVWDLTFRVKLSCLYFLGKYWYIYKFKLFTAGYIMSLKIWLADVKAIIKSKQQVYATFASNTHSSTCVQVLCDSATTTIIKIGQIEWGIPCWFLSLITVMHQCQHFRLWMKIWFQVISISLFTNWCMLIIIIISVETCRGCAI